MIITFVLVGLVVIVSGLFITLRLGKQVENRKSELDPEPKATRNHPILLNPVFLAYVIGFGGLLIFAAYLFLTWK
ncbi:hypothetical protein [Saliterribacillus persicus]|uniref:Uncharacterized protein n=1 Tax=Saliterribacillus persicus TaxID=930114 RepID=A0A368Y4B8_9BACI|nr:hypothetical protein [Saliterribacillus persicus]RCW74945.1 hypothetical protein DFR57_103242 [Saliterribacillus persicus]